MLRTLEITINYRGINFLAETCHRKAA